MKVTESSKEQWISTPQLSITTRQTHRSREMNKTMAEVGFNHPVLRYDRFNINGNQLAPSNVSTMDTTDTTSSFQLPDALKQLIGTKSNYTLKIVERQFDISVRDGKVSTVQALEDAPARGLSKAKPSQANNQKVFFSPQKVLTLKKTIAKKKLPVKNDETMRNMRKAKNVEEPHKEVKEYKKKLKSVSEEKIEHEKKQTKRTQVMRRGRSAAVTANVQKDALMALKENFKKIVTAEEIVTKPVEFSNQDIIMTNSSDLQLVDISCGSSCSTVTSGDEKYYDPKKYTDLRRKKKYLHRRKKLLERTKSTCPISDTETQVKSCVTKAKLDKIEEDSYSSDDFFFKKEPMTKRPSPVKVKAPEAKKVQVISLIDSDSDF